MSRMPYRDDDHPLLCFFQERFDEFDIMLTRNEEFELCWKRSCSYVTCGIDPYLEEDIKGI